MTDTMSKALEAATLRDKLLLAISEVHSGNGTEGEQIADAVLSVIAHLAEDEAVVERLSEVIADAMNMNRAGRLEHDAALAVLRTLSGKE